MLKNTLYITFDGLSDPLGQSQILPYLRGLAANGYTITILSCEKNERLVKEKENILNSIQHLPIQWKWINYNEAGGILSRLNYIRKLFRLAKQTLHHQPIQLVHCRSYLAALIGLSLKTKQGIPFVFDMRGFWADERIDGGIWHKSNPVHWLLYLFFKRKEKQYLQQADAIVSLTHAAVKELDHTYPELGIPAKTQVIPCCTDTTAFDPSTVKKAAVKGLTETDHVLVYTGSVGTWYYTREMIDCFLVWRSSIPALKLFIVTKDQTELTTLLNSYPEEVKSAIVCSSVSYAEVPSVLALARASIFFIKPAYSKIASSPTKMAECWAMNLPIITNSGIGDNDYYFNEQQGGVLIDNFSEADYQAALVRYKTLPEKSSCYRQLALDFFDNKTAIARYSEIYQAVLNPLSTSTQNI